MADGPFFFYIFHITFIISILIVVTFMTSIFYVFEAKVRFSKNFHNRKKNVILILEKRSH